MKKIIITISGVFLVLICILISVLYFRGDADAEPHKLSEKEKARIAEREEERALDDIAIKQEVNVNSILEDFADLISVKPQQVTSVGTAIQSGAKEFTITSWSMGKEYPGYPLPEDMDLSERGIELDEGQNIVNGYSYVVVNVLARNTKENDVITQYIWGGFRLKSTNKGEYLGEVAYLGCDESKERTKDYYKDTIQPGESIERTLIFIAPDKKVTDTNLYIEINPSGGGADIDVSSRRYIVLGLEDYDFA